MEPPLTPCPNCCPCPYCSPCPCPCTCPYVSPHPTLSPHPCPSHPSPPSLPLKSPQHPPAEAAFVTAPAEPNPEAPSPPRASAPPVATLVSDTSPGGQPSSSGSSTRGETPLPEESPAAAAVPLGSVESVAESPLVKAPGSPPSWEAPVAVEVTAEPPSPMPSCPVGSCSVLPLGSHEAFPSLLLLLSLHLPLPLPLRLSLHLPLGSPLLQQGQHQ